MSSFDEYWNAALALDAIELWEGDLHPLWLKIHTNTGTYHRDSARGGEIVPLSQPRGARVYVQAKPLTVVPDIRLTFGIYPTPHPAEAIGEVTSSRWEHMKPLELGNAQAWYYPADRILVLWEAILEAPYRKAATFTDDPNTRALWSGFEAFLLRQFPETELIAPPHSEPLYKQKEYHQFLRKMGYRKLQPTAFGKTIVQLSAVT
jgi:hypothetical protein